MMHMSGEPVGQTSKCGIALRSQLLPQSENTENGVIMVDGFHSRLGLRQKDVGEELLGQLPNRWYSRSQELWTRSLKCAKLDQKPQAKEDKLLSKWQCFHWECYEPFKDLVTLTFLAEFKIRGEDDSPSKPNWQYGETCPASCTEAAGRRHRRVRGRRINEGAGRKAFKAALYMPTGGGEHPKKKDRTQVLKLDKAQWGSTVTAWNPKISTKDVG